MRVTPPAWSATAWRWTCVPSAWSATGRRWWSSRCKQRVDELTVRSPVAGTVANLAVTEKTRVAADAALITVVDLSAFEIEFQVAESYAGDIKAGMAAADHARGARHCQASSPRSPPRCGRTRSSGA